MCRLSKSKYVDTTPPKSLGLTLILFVLLEVCPVSAKCKCPKTKEFVGRVCCVVEVERNVSLPLLQTILCRTTKRGTYIRPHLTTKG